MQNRPNCLESGGAPAEKFLKMLIRWNSLFSLILVAAFAVGCSQSGFSTDSMSQLDRQIGVPRTATPTPTPGANSPVATLLPTTIQVAAGAGVNLTGSGGSKAHINVGVGQSDTQVKTTNGYRVFLSVSSQTTVR